MKQPVSADLRMDKKSFIETPRPDLSYERLPLLADFYLRVDIRRGAARAC